MRCTTTGRRGVLACAIWAAAAMSGCMMGLDDPADTGGDEALNLLYSEAIPAGKCDPYLSPGFGGGAVITVVGSSFGVFGAATWTASGAANAPHTDFMVLDSPTDTTDPVMTSCTGPLTQTGCAEGFGPYPVIAETYIHLWDAPYTPYP